MWQRRTQTSVLAVTAHPASPVLPAGRPLPSALLPRWRGLWARSAPCGPGVGVGRMGPSPLSGCGNRVTVERKPRVLLPAPCFSHTGLRPVLSLGPASALSFALDLLLAGNTGLMTGRKRTTEAGWPSVVCLSSHQGATADHTQNCGGGGGARRVFSLSGLSSLAIGLRCPLSSVPARPQWSQRPSPLGRGWPSWLTANGPSLQGSLTLRGGS